MKIRGFLTMLATSMLLFVCTSYAMPFSQAMKKNSHYRISVIYVVDKTRTFSHYPTVLRNLLALPLIGKNNSTVEIANRLSIIRHLLVYSGSRNANVMAWLKPTKLGYLLRVEIYNTKRMQVVGVEHNGYPDALVNAHLAKMIKGGKFYLCGAQRQFILANSVPGLQSAYYLQPISKDKVKLVTLQDLHRLQWGASFGNGGNKESGHYLFGFNAALNHLLGNDRLSVGYGFANRVSRNQMLTVAYQHVLNRFGTTVHFGFVNSWNESQVFTDEYQYRFSGESYTASVFQPLITSARKQLGLDMGYTYLDGFNRGVSQGTFSDLTVKEETPYLYAKLRFKYLETIGRFWANATIAQGVALGSQEELVTGRAAARDPGKGVSLDFTRFDFDAAQQFYLPKNWGLLLSGSSQLAGKSPVPISQKYTFAGGAFAGEGYSGDNGVALRAELQYNWLLNYPSLHSIQFYGYGATAWLENPEQFIIDYEHKSVSTAGLGFRLGLLKYVGGFFEVAKPFEDLSVKGDRSWRVLFGLNVQHF